MEKSIREIAKIAANWWAEVIADPKFDFGSPSHGSVCVFGPILARMAVKSVTPEARRVFAEKLAEAIVERLKGAEGANEIWLGVDYAPDAFLRGIAQMAGIPESNFPVKTNMWISKNCVSVSYGYRAKQQVLYAKKEGEKNG